MTGVKGSVNVNVIGDSGHFSSSGKGSSFIVSSGGNPGFLLDCGASPFSTVGAEMLGKLQGLIATHSHEDHKRWFSEMALFFRYDVQPPRKLTLLSTETIHEEIRVTSQAALERTLSNDLRRIIDVPYDDFIEQVVIGPKALYRIALRPASPGSTVVRVIDSRGDDVSPEKAKVVEHPDGGRPRMIFFDEQYSEWVEPECFYHFGARAFYEKEQNPATDPASGMTVRPVKAAGWHGPPTVSIIVETPEGTRVAFSSDIRFDPALWERLAEETRDIELGMSAREFDKAPVIRGDVNQYVQRTWSPERYEAAVKAFDGCVVFHDTDATQTVVHTPYDNLEEHSSGLDGQWRALVMAYTPDYFVGRRPITAAGRRFNISRDEVKEVLRDGSLASFAGEVYAKSGDRLYVGYMDEEGEHRLLKTARGLDLVPRLPVPPGMGEPPQMDESAAEEIGRVSLYRDIGGRHVPCQTAENTHYRLRDDGRIELLTETAEGSTARIVEDERRG